MTGSLQESSTDGNLVWIMDEGTVAGLLLGALAELVEEHAVLLAPVGVLHDGVDAPVLGLGDGLSGQGMSGSCEHSRLHLLQFFSSQIHLLTVLGAVSSLNTTITLGC